MRYEGKLVTLPYDDNKRESIFCCKRVLCDGYALHSHNFFEIEFLMDGEGIQIINGKRYPWRAGTICFFAPTDFHEIVAISPLTFYNISFDAEGVSKETVERLMDLGENAFASAGIEQSHFEKLASMLADATEHSEIFGEEYTALLLKCFLAHLYRIADYLTRLNAQQPLVKKAALFMHANFNKKITLSEIAADVHLSSAYLSKLFSEGMGMPVFRYLAELRIDYAKKLLDSTADSVTEVCFSSGYTSLPNFMKDFKRIVGVSPLKYRMREKTAEKKEPSE